MNIHLEKCLRIMNDLVTYCHYQGATEYSMHLRHKDGVGFMTICAQTGGISADRLEELTSELNLHRHREIEQSYWELSGTSDVHNDLTLIGMMIDRADVEYQDGALRIQLWRYD